MLDHLSGFVPRFVIVIKERERDVKEFTVHQHGT